MKTVLDLESNKARKFFLKSDSYLTFDLPNYFLFKKLLSKTNEKLQGSEISDFFANGKNPKDLEDVNHLILSNKDGELAWRPFELIHPALYVSLVHTITEQTHWKSIQERFEKFQETGIICESIPTVSTTQQSDKAEQVRKWWEKIEQHSVEMGLDYEYIFDADIADCYGSIYTHAIPWALHSKKTSKEQRNDDSLLGNQIDKQIRMMRHGQTNGIPQGSVLMDLIAEIVLGYVDEKLTNKIDGSGIEREAYKILRYRDDYRVFTNKPGMGKDIVKFLSQRLSSIGMKLNPSKFKETADPVLSSVKEDKIDELFIPTKIENISKWLFQIYASVKKHPNSGTVVRQLLEFRKELKKRIDSDKGLSHYEKTEVMVSIIANMATRNPGYYHWTLTIMSLLIENCSKSKSEELLERLQNKFDRVPNTGLLEIWLQRISYPIEPSIEYQEKLTKLLEDSPYPGNTMWNSEWLHGDLKTIIETTSIIDFEELESKSPVISEEEIELFRNMY